MRKEGDSDRGPNSSGDTNNVSMCTVGGDMDGPRTLEEYTVLQRLKKSGYGIR